MSDGPPERRGDVERIVPGRPHWEVLYPEHIQRYEFVAKLMKPGALVLDAGCGSGYGAAYLVDHGAGRVVAIDIALEALNIARQHFHREEIVWLEDNCETMEKAAQYAPFDLVCNLETIEHLKEPDQFLRRVTQLIKPEGILITSTPNRVLANQLRSAPADAPPRNPYHCSEYTSDEFKTLLLSHFNDVRLEYQYRPLGAGVRLSIKLVLRGLSPTAAMWLGSLWRCLASQAKTFGRLGVLFMRHRWRIVQDDPGPNATWTFIGICRQPKTNLC